VPSRRSSRKPKGKYIGSRDITGERGIALIHTVVSEMGFVWNATKLEAGIDGYIEIRDPITGAMTNLIIQVQSKATDHDFLADTPTGFDYYCEQRPCTCTLRINTTGSPGRLSKEQKGLYERALMASQWPSRPL